MRSSRQHLEGDAACVEPFAYPLDLSLIHGFRNSCPFSHPVMSMRSLFRTKGRRVSVCLCRGRLIGATDGHGAQGSVDSWWTCQSEAERRLLGPPGSGKGTRACVWPARETCDIFNRRDPAGGLRHRAWT